MTFLINFVFVVKNTANVFPEIQLSFDKCQIVIGGAII